MTRLFTRILPARFAVGLAVGWLALDPAVCRATPPNVVSLGAYGQALRAPARVAVDSAGNFYVTDPQAGQVVVLDPFGRKTATHGGFARPLGIAVDVLGNIYLSEELSGSVSVFDPQWNLLYKLGSGNGEFLLPGHLALDPASGGLYVSDGKANQIKVYAGATLTNQFGSPGTGAGQFNFPAGICVSTNGEVFVVDQNNDRVQVFDRAGSYLRAFALGSGNPSGRSQAACLDNAGRLYVADGFQGLVKVFDASSGAALGTVGGFGVASGQLNLPVGLGVDAFSRLGVASANNGRIELFGLDAFLHVSVDPAVGPVAAGSNLVFQVVTGSGTWNYQWQRNGTNLVGATNAVLTVPSVTQADAGGYSIVATGPGGAVTGSVAQVTVLVPPGINSGPQSQTVQRGTTVLFYVLTSGDALGYQWLYNGSKLPGATNASLFLTDVQNVQVGDYSVVVSNALGVAVSSAATLSVIVPPAVVEMLPPFMDTDQVFHVTLNSDPGYNYTLEASTNLAQWQSLIYFSNDVGILEYLDADATNYWNRYYRLHWTP